MRTRKWKSTRTYKTLSNMKARLEKYTKAIRVIASCENVIQLEYAKNYIENFLTSQSTKKGQTYTTDEVTWDRYYNLQSYYAKQRRKLF